MRFTQLHTKSYKAYAKQKGKFLRVVEGQMESVILKNEMKMRIRGMT